MLFLLPSSLPLYPASTTLRHIVPSPSRSSPSEKPHVMFTGMIDKEGEKTVRELGGELADSVYSCTHLVTDKVSCVAVITDRYFSFPLCCSDKW